MTTLLAGDIGGTKTLLSLHDGASLEPLSSQRYPSADWDDLGAMVRGFLRETEAQGLARPAAACLAVAGPVHAGRAQLTNLHWLLEEAALARDCGIARLELVNDFAVLIYGLPHLQAAQVESVRRGEAEPEAPLLILGAGTGLGVALGVHTRSGLQAQASEASHGEFAPRSQEEWELRQWIRADRQLERVSIERVVSGTGLGDVARWLLANRDPQGTHPLTAQASRWLAGEVVREATPTSAAERADLPAAVAAAAAAGDSLAQEALEIWLGAYGSVCGDLGLASLSRGGIWLAGGTAAKLLDGLRSRRFSEAFLAKGRLRAVLEPMPIQAVIDPAFGSFSAACRARMLLHQAGTGA
ncbi:MAG: glucokinase [Synechococcaceae cyanobacterium ELA739]